MIRAAIFDFDETMVQLEEQHGAASAALCALHGDDYDRLPESFRHRSGHRGVDDVAEMKSFFGWRRSLEDLYALRQELFQEECDRSEIVLLPGVEKLVRQLAAKGLALGIASSGSGESIRRIVERLGLDDFFSAIVAGEDVDRGKPDPEPYVVAADRLDVTPGECVVFEDSSVGVRSAKAAGCVCIGVRNPLARSLQDLDAADLVVTGLSELDEDDLERMLSG